MTCHFAVCFAMAGLLLPGAAPAQQPAGPIPLYPAAGPSAIAPEPVAPAAPPPEPQPAPALPSSPPPAAASVASASAPAARVFCGQSVSLQIADPDAVPGRYRGFLGMFSDASWTPQLCAALVVENVTNDGTATIVYAFGPMSPSENGPSGVLHGTGIIKSGELRFENSDGSQFAFRPLYADLKGRLTTPQGQAYEAVFERTQ